MLGLLFIKVLSVLDKVVLALRVIIAVRTCYSSKGLTSYLLLGFVSENHHGFYFILFKVK